MGSGDFSTDLNLGMLSPTPAVRPAEGHSPPQDAEAKARRRLRAEADQDGTEPEAAADDSADPHQLDRLA